VPGGRREEILEAARGLLEEQGAAALTMRRLGERLGIKAPSLYKHVAGKQELEAALIALGLEEVGSVLAAAARGATEPLAALGAAYRSFALARPHLYRLMTERPLPRERLPEGLEDRAAAPLLEAAGSRDRARAIWAFAHGLVHLELAGRFPPGADIDAAWREGIAAFRPGPGVPLRPSMPDAPVRAVVRSVRGPD
jgi:AcrR family transcriptional regulator